MSVLIEAICLVVSRAALHQAFPGQTDAFLAAARETDASRYAIADKHLAVVSANDRLGLSPLVQMLTGLGLTAGSEQRDRGFVIVEARNEPTATVDWLHIERHPHGFVIGASDHDAERRLVSPPCWTPAVSWSLDCSSVHDPDSMLPGTAGASTEMQRDFIGPFSLERQHEGAPVVADFCIKWWECGEFIDHDGLRLRVSITASTALKSAAFEVVLPLRISCAGFERRRRLFDYDTQDKYGWPSFSESVHVDPRTRTVAVRHIAHEDPGESWEQMVWRGCTETLDRGAIAFIGLAKAKGVSLDDLISLHAYFSKWRPGHSGLQLGLEASNLAYTHYTIAEERGEVGDQKRWWRLAMASRAALESYIRAQWPVCDDDDDDEED